MELTDATIRTAGILLLSIVAVEYGGIFVLGIHRGKQEFTDFQKASFRAGHAHAGVLLVLSRVGLLYADSLDLGGSETAWRDRRYQSLPSSCPPASSSPPWARDDPGPTFS